MDKQQAKELLDKYNNGTASSEEINLVESWFLHLKSMQAHGLSEEMIDRNTDELWRSLKQQLPIRKVTLWPRIAAAVAIVVGLFGAGIWYFNNDKLTDNQLTSDIKPGSNKAYLTLANGQKISLSDAANGNIAQQAGITINKMADGELIYEVQSTDNAIAEVTYNTIETPNGGQYQVRLPDGTAVWLNAASSLRYPTSFTAKKERRVQLSGEGYFQVAKDKSRPFIVSASHQEVEVLGTHFNINAYGDEGDIKTTLLEGSVKVGNTGKETKILRPGEQSVNKNGSMAVAKVNTDYAVAWKNGYFRFNDKTLEMGLREIARWYNVDIVYEKESLKGEPLAGRVSKYDNINQVLKKMEMAGFFHFSIQGRKIIVK